MAGALSSKLKLMSSQTNNLRASVDTGNLKFKLGIEKVTSDMRIEILNENLEVIIGAKSTLSSVSADKVDSNPGSMSQTIDDDWVWNAGDDAKGHHGSLIYKTKLSEQTFEIGYPQNEYGNSLSIVPNCNPEGNDNPEGNECEYTISGAGFKPNDIIYIAACQKDDRSTTDKKMTCSIQQLNAYGHVISPTDMTNQFKFSTYYPMGVVMRNATNECERMCVDGYGKMTEGFEENVEHNGNAASPDNIHEAFQVQVVVEEGGDDGDDHGHEGASYCDLTEHITYSAGCTRPNSLGSTCDICD